MPLKFLLLALLATVALYLAYHAAQVYRHIRISAGLVAAAVPYERAEGAKRLLVAGDSTAAGVGASSPERTTAGYFAAEHPEYSVHNVAKSGATVSDALAQVRGAPGGYDLALIQAGGNDTIRFTGLAALRADYAALLAEAKARSPRVIALSTGNVGTAPLFDFFPLNRIYEARTRAVRAVLRDEAAKAGVAYVDLFKERDEPDEIREAPGLHYSPDGLHLSDQGWLTWYREIKAAYAWL